MWFAPGIGQAQAIAMVDYETLYAQGVAEGIIPSADVSLETWVGANENEYKQVYQEGLRDDVYDASMTYEE
ncbi:TPA: hypothetical protein IQA20_002989, partial [Listeria monocytogenes]|nr:hypothetical protein [Listeria monocytogenes]